MIYPRDLETKLGFDKVRLILKENCISSLGEHFVENLAFSTNCQKINLWQDQTREFIQIISSASGFPQTDYLDISHYLKQAEIPGSHLDLEALHEIKLSMRVLIQISDFFERNSIEYPVLASKLNQMVLNISVHQELGQKIDEKGELKNDASAELASIRESIVRAQNKARSSINKVLKSANSSGFTPEDSELTIRDGRLVIPILAEHKRHIRGFVHDESSTGQTVFLEPAEVLEINNEVRELRYAERREIIRILTQLTDRVRESSEELHKGMKVMGVLDFVRSKALFALEYDCMSPKLEKFPALEWKDARHPLLERSLNEQGKKIKPLDIQASRENRILLISGPNAGGKSVTIKTLGLLQFMAQCGLPVPVREDSKFGVFGSLFIDIGDEQSIENDLSTYSSHLTNMKHFLEHSDKKTLFLIDEFGTGTEPQFGGAIAETVLFDLNRSGAYGAITTHYGNLKKLADQQQGIINAAMKFDVKKLEPLYELEIGKPGSSFALEIAGKIGLNKNLLGRAQKKAGISHVQFDRMLNELENEKNQLEKDKKAIDAKNKRLSDAIKDYEDLKKYMDKQKSQVLKDAKDEAARLIRNSNKQIESTIKRIQESKADKRKTQQAREALRLQEEKLVLPSVEVQKQTPVKVEEVQVGDKVKIITSGAAGEVVSIKGKQAELTLGGLTSRVKLSDLEKVSSKEFKKSTEDRVKNISGIDLNKKMAEFSATLDIRGVRAEEAFIKVENYMDEAVFLGFTEVKILHGKGYGVLRDLVRTILKDNPKVIGAKDEHVERGGAGITVVTLDE